MPDDDKQSPLGRGFGEGYEHVALALAVPIAMLLFGGVGWLVDGWLHTRPLFAIIGGVLRAVAGGVRVYYRGTGAGPGGRGRAGGGGWRGSRRPGPAPGWGAGGCGGAPP